MDHFVGYWFQMKLDLWNLWNLFQMDSNGNFFGFVGLVSYEMVSLLSEIGIRLKRMPNHMPKFHMDLFHMPDWDSTEFAEFTMIFLSKNIET